MHADEWPAPARCGLASVGHGGQAPLTATPWAGTRRAMKFNRLRLTGFKTFVEPSEMLIEPGLTGVVGPNGCGKSNLMEAMRWVMGESSHKAFRAQDMDDVIFGGNAGRPARNMAEVVLYLDNSDRTAPAGFNDTDHLEVVRRIDRGAGSHYRINGRDVRARDVHLLFADASTGARSPALVRQGQIGEIVGAKPSARRRILEEAAGVSGLHARRHEAELRLKGAEANLLRLEDVITQMASQVEALRRQSRQAVRYRAVADEIRRQEATLLWLRWREVTSLLAEAERAIDTAQRETAERTRAQSEAARLQAIAAHHLPGLRQKEVEAAAALQRLTLARSEIDKEEARIAARRQDLERRMAQLSQDMGREDALSADAEGVLARLAAESEDLALQHEESAALEAEAAETVEEAEARLEEAEAALDAQTQAFADLGARRSALDARLREARSRLTRAAAERASVDAEEGRLRQDAGTDALAQRTAEAEVARERLDAAEDAAATAESLLAQARQAAEALRPKLAEAERRFGALDTEARTLAKLLQSTDRRFPPVADHIKVAKGYEIALGAALGDDLDLPEDERATARWAGAHPAPSDPPLPAGADPLARYVTGADVLTRRLAQVGIVAPEAGARLQAGLHVGQRLVSRAGDLWRWDGLTAAADAPTAAARRLAERNRLADLEDEVRAAEAEVRAVRSESERLEAQVRAAAGQEAQAREARRAAQRSAEQAREAEAAAERKAAQYLARLSALAEARTRILAAHEEGEAAVRAVDTELATLEAPALIEATLANARAAAAQARAFVTEARAGAAALQRDRATRTRRLEAIAREEASWTERAGGAGARIAALQARRDEAEAELAETETAPGELALRRRSLMNDLEVAEAARRAAADRLAEGEAALAAADRAARATLEAMAAAREDGARAEARVEAARQRRDDVVRDIADALEGPPDVARDHAGLTDDAPLPGHPVDVETRAGPGAARTRPPGRR